ncbi:GntR family transcriptional regulator [Roseomonas xinghualingensis]|uniref:GntR family transcriptional regulator n=1 Tax=Roseomonas xinghualingensis TaxID=2986475 RepID=UPI0021F1B7C9|nr:GntR family transcriptional regulator [Roseomonas sp. SXEYE001]MCV4207331.1 GntR family transcriptional regulator [Roseomonas sp. SXEYE001]
MPRQMKSESEDRDSAAGNPAPRASLGESAYRALRARLLEMTLPPGHQATEGDLAAQLGMSRTPVHEAVLRLQAEGFLEVQPRRGIRVLPIDPTGMAETYEILIALEGAAAARLAGKGDDATLGLMAQATESMREALARGDRHGWAAADDRFHRALVQNCGNTRLARMAQEAADLAQRARLATAALRPEPAGSADEHVRILEALRQRDPEAARAALSAHRQRASAEILRTLALPLMRLGGH